MFVPAAVSLQSTWFIGADSIKPAYRESETVYISLSNYIKF